MPSGKWGDKEWTRKVEEAYWRGGSGVLDGAMVDRVAGALAGGALRTEYRAVESDVVGLAVKW
jgi:hypothetical protein